MNKSSSKVAFALWDGRIAPVFDTTRQLALLEVDAGRAVREAVASLKVETLQLRVNRLVELGVTTLVCGAISKNLRETIEASGIQVVPFIAGEFVEVKRAWLTGALTPDTYAMPGCCRRGRSCRGGLGGMARGGGAGEARLSGRDDDGEGHFRPRRRAGMARDGNSPAEGAIAYCRCPDCGHREPHEQGIPCQQKKCPKCGTSLIRERVT